MDKMKEMIKEILYIDMDDVLCEYKKGISDGLIKEPNVQYPQSRYGFYTNLEPVQDAIYSYFRLKQFFSVKILSRPSVKNPLSYTEKRIWIEKHLGHSECYNLILSKDKTLLRGDWLIDDNIQEGLLKPEWKHIHFGSNEFPNWNSITKYLINYINNQII